MLAFNSTGSLVIEVHTVIRPRTNKFFSVGNPCSNQVPHDPLIPSGPSGYNPLPPFIKFICRHTVDQGVPFCLPKNLTLLVFLPTAQFIHHVFNIIPNMPYTE